ncbi:MULTISPECIES: hypothetical protein [unclassified Yoonia]|uniref:hypothetical protein n=1 Tax=unclassified Yoonia TaxID=2629118 RepID=UPI002AFF340A|nr:MULTISPECIES: hypothetical protein [unclassified Yoonia]
MKFAVDRDDSSDLGFANVCRISGAVSREEFIQWVYWVIENSTEDLPSFFFELDELEKSATSFDRIVGFVPSSGLKFGEEDAVDGIAYCRNVDVHGGYDAHVGRTEAIAALHRNPQVAARFSTMFPFIEWSMPPFAS